MAPACPMHQGLPQYPCQRHANMRFAVHKVCASQRRKALLRQAYRSAILEKIEARRQARGFPPDPPMSGIFAARSPDGAQGRRAAGYLFCPATTSAPPSPRVRGEGRMRGLFGWAQNRGGAPSPDCFAIQPHQLIPVFIIVYPEHICIVCTPIKSCIRLNVTAFTEPCSVNCCCNNRYLCNQV